VKLWVEQDDERLNVSAPAAPGLAVPGYYLLFVVSEEGVPSHARVVHLDYRGPDRAGKVDADR
jgi:galactose oxidase-like protein